MVSPLDPGVLTSLQSVIEATASIPGYLSPSHQPLSHIYNTCPLVALLLSTISSNRGGFRESCAAVAAIPGSKTAAAQLSATAI